jgi:Na+-transporting methylmalonyl-CoA/oxaloacetate decarboxylase gamma subunit
MSLVLCFLSLLITSLHLLSKHLYDKLKNAPYIDEYNENTMKAVVYLMCEVSATVNLFRA